MSGFWSVFIGLITIVSILALLALLIANARGTPGESTGHVWDEDLREYNNPLPRWWLVMFVLSIVFGLVYLQLYPGVGDFEGNLGWTQDKQLRERLAEVQQKRNARYEALQGLDMTSLQRHPEALALGRAVYVAQCSGCHGQDARGALGFPDLTDADWLYGAGAESVLTSIREGRQGRMPAFAAVLDDAALTRLAGTIRNWDAAGADPAGRTEGLALFAQHCAACHGAEGRGSPALGAPNLRDAVWLHGGSAEQVLATLRQGRSSQMPAHKDLIAAEEIRAVGAYVLSLSATP
ncbi:MAG TPA: cytochrome-c oxidase, cbb3-type subunit III [Solimonas sp.]|nr:cytochrome-c oxidase, cbb3-type subunit III [Solimonas sp.]